MASKLYLMSGNTSSGRLTEIDKKALDDAENKSILVVNLSYDDIKKLKKKKDFFDGYFREIGAENIEFIELKSTEKEIESKLKGKGLIYLPGGDTRILIPNLIKKGLDKRIREFEGIVSGNSAGNYSLCPDYLRIGRGSIEIIPALGFVDFWTKAHYEPKFDSDLIQLSNGRKIYALENESAIVCEGDILSFLGNIWKFSGGEKRRIN